MMNLIVGDDMARPEKTIDWELVDRLLESQCTAKEIAGTLGIHEDTLYLRVKDKYRMNYTDYSAKMSSKGLGLLRASQLKKALSGNPQMLQWLGKQYLKQSESPSDATVTDVINNQYNELMDQLRALQSPALNNADISFNTESRSE